MPDYDLWQSSAHGRCPECGKWMVQCWIYIHWRQRFVLLIFENSDGTLCARALRQASTTIDINHNENNSVGSTAAAMHSTKRDNGKPS